MNRKMPDDVVLFVGALRDAMGADNFNAALRLNAAEPCEGVCHMHDFCDPNQCALDLTGDDIDAAAALYDSARPWLRGEAQA